MAVTAARGAAALLVRADRAGSRFGCLGDPDDRRAARRRLRPQRVEDVHHERWAGGVVRRLRLDRPGRWPPRSLGVRGSGRVRRDRGRGASGQTRPTCNRHFSARVPRGSGAGRKPARPRGRGIQDRDAHARLDPAGHRGRRGRRRAGGLRARRRVLEGPHPVWPADRDQPGRQLPHRRHGRGDRGGEAADLAGRVADRPGRAGDAAILVRQALRRGHRHEGDDRHGPDLRRLRLHEGISGREADARREAVPDLRGDLADPAARDRP